MLEPVSVGLKFAFLVVLYLFLMWVGWSAIRDLRRGRRGVASPAQERTQGATGMYSAAGAPIGAANEAEAEPAPAPAEQSGRTMVYSAAGRVAEPLEERARERHETVLLVLDGRRLLVGPTGVTLGRSSRCDVVLDDQNVSRQHAELRPRGGSWVLTDLGSTNGSSVNGRRIDAPTVVKPGDEIELGTSVMTFELE